jgi:cold shock CspA family protein/ribosome-associated translation inhibitor RaiA
VARAMQSQRIMQIPVEITFRDIEHSDAVETRIRELVDKLERVYDRITRCEVTIGQPHHRHRKGNAFSITVRLTVPGGEIVSSHDPGPDGAHEDVYVALRDAFHATKRQLEDHVRTHLRRDVKNHDGGSRAHGRVTFLDVQKDWGWIEPEDGRRIYFHRNSVLDGKMDNVELGDEVRFAEEQGNDGPQASSVELIGANGRHQLKAV